jgi:transcriptional regulator with XRE-family HTH domain
LLTGVDKINTAQHKFSSSQHATWGASQRLRYPRRHPSDIAFWELSGTPPRGEVLPKLAHALGVSVDALLGVTPPKPKKQAAKGRL